MNYRYSSSLLKIKEACDFRFYCKVSGQPEDEQQNNSYGDSGNVVHYTVKYYFDSGLVNIPFDLALNELRHYFDELWEAMKIQNSSIDINEYWLCVINCIKLKFTYTDFEYEFKGFIKTQIDGKEHQIEYVGYADILDRLNDHIGDWKTSSYKSSKVEEYKIQLLFYAYCYYKEFHTLPKLCWVYFAKTSKPPFNFVFTLQDVLSVEKRIIDEYKKTLIQLKTLDFKRRPSRTNCFFCQFKTVCSSNLLRHNVPVETLDYSFHLKKQKLLVEGPIDDVLHRKIETICNYEVKNAHFIQQAMRMKGIHFDGIKRLWRRKEYGGETFQGYSHQIHTLLKEEAHSKGKLLQLTIKDYRNQEVMNSKITVPEKLNIPFDMYDFQIESVDALLKYRWGIIEVGTGGGKTVIAAEAIRRCATRTLFVIDNKALLMQTKREYEEMLGIKCGIVGTGKTEWNYDIVLATIQTLAKYLKEFAAQLSTFNCVIYDEVHIIAAKSFENLSKYLINTKYRFGFSATARRDDGDDKIIYAHSGNKVYVKKARALIDKGYLVEPECIFYHYSDNLPVSDTWQNEYENVIVNNAERNEAIRILATKYATEGKQVMVLTKYIEHGQNLSENIPGAKFIFGQTKDEIREDVIQDFKEGKFNILVGNIKIFNKGLNFKNLDVLINASGNAGDVVTIQSIGRELRKNPGKDGAIYIDFLDPGEYCKNHSNSRMQALKDEDYKVNIKKLA